MKLTKKEIEAINNALEKGFEVEIFPKPDGTNNIKTVRKKRLVIE